VRTLAIATIVLAALTGAALAEPSAEWHLGQRGQPHAGVPFSLVIVVDGFEEQPAPEQPKLELAGAKVTPAGVQPNVSRSIQIINGRRSETIEVRWLLQWNVVVANAGRVRVPSLAVEQSGKKARADATELVVDSVPTADDMKLALELPDRPIFLGESTRVTLAWLFRREPSDWRFTVPLASSDEVTVTAPPIDDPRRALELDVGAKKLQVPYVVDPKPVEVGGVQYRRLAMTLLVVPRKAGKLDVAPATVVAALPIGRPDFFGNAQTKLFRASDIPRTLEVKPLPETDRPPSFAGAVGTQFSIAVATSRSVVSLGEPVKLVVTIKSDQPLDALALPRLDGPDGLPKDKFVVPAEPPTGALSEEGKTKTFEVTAQVTGPATEVPALAFSYFDPVRRAYQTIRSEPIALSVKGSSVVGATDVIAARPSKPSTSAGSPADEAEVGAVDLALADPAQLDDRPWSGGLLWALVAALYAIPLGVLALRTWQLRTAARREDAAEVRAARRRVDDVLDRAAAAPARDVAGPLADALRAYAKTLGVATLDDRGLIAALETESFAPGASSATLAPELRGKADALARRWHKEAHARGKKRGVAAAAILLGALAPTPARAEAGARGPSIASSAGEAGARADSPQNAIDRGRAAYGDALAMTNATERKAAFARAEIALGDAAAALPDRPELLDDWGTAALQAGDVATATLAYRRALAVDASNARARRNLGFLRDRQPQDLRPAHASAADTLLFFHQWPRSRRIAIGAAAFAIAVLLVVPWARRRRALRALALLPLAAWLALTLSVLLEDRRGDDAIVMSDVVLRAADSAGAPAVLSQPLPPGVEVTIADRRDTWAKVKLASGASGWVPTAELQTIAIH
jgi:hypothetical protein